MLLEVVILIILMVSWLDLGRASQEIEVLEYFSGVGRIAGVARFCGFKSVALDIVQGEAFGAATGRRSPTDMNSNSGFVPLGSCCCERSCSSWVFPRLAVHLLLSGRWEDVYCFLAVVCLSWTPLNRGSTGRHIMTPLGCEDFLHVRKANKLTSRTHARSENIFGIIQVLGSLPLQRSCQECPADVGVSIDGRRLHAGAAREQPNGDASQVYLDAPTAV